jgi:hypothetical protein
MGNGDKLKAKVDALQLNAEGLFKLLGSSDPEKRLEFWERLKGITTRVDLQLVEHELTVMNTLVTEVHSGARTLLETAKEISGAGKAAGSH